MDLIRYAKNSRCGGKGKRISRRYEREGETKQDGGGDQTATASNATGSRLEANPHLQSNGKRELDQCCSTSVCHIFNNFKNSIRQTYYM